MLKLQGKIIIGVLGAINSRKIETNSENIQGLLVQAQDVNFWALKLPKISLWLLGTIDTRQTIQNHKNIQGAIGQSASCHSCVLKLCKP